MSWFKKNISKKIKYLLLVSRGDDKYMRFKKKLEMSGTKVFSVQGLFEKDDAVEKGFNYKTLWECHV